MAKKPSSASQIRNHKAMAMGMQPAGQPAAPQRYAKGGFVQNKKGGNMKGMPKC